jgi:DNA-binding NtrC family response regulator
VDNTNNKYIVIADDEPLTRKSLYEILKYQGYRVVMTANGQEALEVISKDPPDILISDLKMPKIDGLTLLRSVKKDFPSVSIVLMTAYGSINSAVEAMKEGAFDYVTKPILDSEIKIVIERIFEQKRLLDENSMLKDRLTQISRNRFHSIIGGNSMMQKLYHLIESVASTNATVLIEGESGTGKRVVAQAIHSSDSNRKDKPFVEVSCGALPENLLESELFGHVKGSFTGAIKDRMGRFQAADGGTIFLDEIDTFSPKLQVKLLRVLQEGEFEIVGDTTTIKVDVRVIAATNQHLKKCISEGTFREDLYYRLNVIPLVLPPLRERRDDIPLLIEHFLEKSIKKMKNKEGCSIMPAVVFALSQYNWPGNVRELENVIERIVILCKEPRIAVDDLPDYIKNVNGQSPEKTLESLSLKSALKSSEKDIVERALRQFNGNRKKAAEFLDINRTTLYNKMKEYGLLNGEE